MKKIERSLILSTKVMIEESQSLMEIIERYPTDKINSSRRQTISENIGKGFGFLKALKMIICDHNKGKGSTTGVSWIQDVNYKGKIIHSYKEVTRRCDYCNQVFYRKKYNLRRKKK